MKRIVLCSLAAAALGSAALAAPFLAVGDGSEVFLTGTVGIQSNDNIFLTQNNTVSDVQFDVTPGFSYEFGKNSLTKGAFAYNEDFRFYGSHSKLNTSLSNVTLSTKYDDGKTKFDLEGSYHQLDQNTVGVLGNGFLVRRDVSDIGATSEVALTEKTSVGAGLTFDDTNYKKPGYTNYRYYQIPVNYYYAIQPKLDLSAGFQFRDNQLGTGGLDSRDYFYNVGARGEFTPKFSGTFRIGLSQQQYAGGGSSTSGLGIASDFTYLATPKTTTTFGISNDYGYSAVGSAYRNFGLNAGVGTAVSDQLNLGAQIGYNDYHYLTTTQDDKFYSGQLYATYVVNAYVKVTGAYAYSKDNSNLAGSSFSNNIFSLSASFRY